MNKFDKDSFTKAVHDVVRVIPSGRATSYGAIARAVGFSSLSRMVGHVMAQSCTLQISIPAHRVVNSQGFLSAKEIFGNLGEMQKLLEAEGIVVIRNRIQNWKTVFWNPLDEITL